MLLVGMDTSSQAASAAVVENGGVVCEYTINQKRTHSAHLLPMLEQMLQMTGFTLEDMDGFACGVGPGSFTGVRIGAATIKGFAQALEKPVVTANSLETLAFGCSSFPGTVVPVIFARVDEVFCAAYGCCSQGFVAQIRPSVMKITSLLETLSEKECLFVGDGAVIHRNLIQDTLGKKARFASNRQNIISASNLALLCEQKVMQNGWERYEEITPLYLRVSQAEREYQEKHGGKKE